MDDSQLIDNRPASWLGLHRCEAMVVTTGEQCKMPAQGKQYCGFHDGSNTPLSYGKEQHDQLRQKHIRYMKNPDGRFPNELRGLTCGAKTREGTPCKQRGLYSGGRCKLHGGWSTGPRTPEGKKRSAQNGKWIRGSD